MSTIRKIATNTGSLAVGRFVNMFTNLFLLSLLTRYLGNEGFGKYTYLFATVGLFGVISDFGVNTILVREIASGRFPADLLIGNGIIMRLFFSLLAMLLFASITAILNSAPDERLSIYIVSFSLLFSVRNFSSFRTVFEVAFQTDLKMEYPVLLSSLGSLLSIALVAIAVYLKGSLLQIVTASVLADIPSFILIAFSVLRRFRPKFKIDLNLWWSILKESVPLALSGVLVSIYFRIDIYMLKAMVDEASVGYYGAAFRLTEALGFIPASFVASIYPLMSKYFEKEEDNLVKLYSYSVRYMLFLALPAAVGVSLLSKPIILLISGEEFLPSSAVLSILIWAEACIFIGMVLSVLLSAIHRQRIIVINASIMVAVNIVLNLILIPKLSFNGAGIATVVTEGLGLVLGFYFISKHLKMDFDFLTILKVVVSVSVMGVFIYFTRGFNLIISIFLGGAIYFILLFLLRGLKYEDYLVLRKSIMAR